MPDIGIPYASSVTVENGDGQILEFGKLCPVDGCFTVIVTKDRKDFESFSGSEYAEHYHRVHVPRETSEDDS